MTRRLRRPDALDPDRIKSHLRTRRIGKEVIVYSSTASTNDVAAEYAKDKDNDGLVVIAEHQTAGRGRDGSRWISARGDSVLCSIVLTDCALKPELLSLACAVAVAEAIGSCSKCLAQIKWPNDIILNNKKTAGILVQSKRIGRRTAYVVGIGINCHQHKEDFPLELRQAATSIDIESGAFTDRVSLTRRLLASVEHWLQTAEQNADEVVERWQRLSTQLGRRVSLVYNKKKFAGNCIGIDPQQGLIVHLDTGATRFFPAAQTSVAK